MFEAIGKLESNVAELRRLWDTSVEREPFVELVEIIKLTLDAMVRCRDISGEKEGNGSQGLPGGVLPPDIRGSG